MVKKMSKYVMDDKSVKEMYVEILDQYVTLCKIKLMKTWME